MQPLQPDTSYHIFNHANGFENIFRKEENYYFFLEKYRLYISPIAETYAYCLMPNHFHLVVRIRKRAAIEELIRNKNKTNFSKVSNFGKVEIEKYLSKQFANLFSCYTQSFNKVYNRMGSLFIKNFKREPILDKAYFLNVIVYTHRNPIHHGFCKDFDEWEFSSYSEITGGFCDTIELVKLLKIVGNLETFKELHQQGLENLNQPELYEMPPIHY
jgi:putative transposase